MTNVVFCDIETQSLCNLKKQGARRYIKHPTSRLMCLVAKSGNDLFAWLPTAPAVRSFDFSRLDTGSSIPPWLRRMVDDDCLFVGHNASGFDAPFLRHHYGLTPRWYDSMHGARASGLPGGLDALGARLGIGGKDDAGKTVMHLLCNAKIGKSGEVRYPVGTPALWESLLHYNLQDVLITERAYNECVGREQEEVVRVHDAINTRGIKIDTEWLGDLLRMWNAIEAVGGDRLAELTGGALTRENAASPQKVKQWLLVQGLQIQSIAKKELEAMYEDPEEYFGSYNMNFTIRSLIDVDKVVEVLLLRQQVTRAMKGKLEKILDSLDDDHRVRDWAVYHGAHTGRFTARGLQPHNLSKGVMGTDPVTVDGKKVDFVEAILKGPRTVEHIREVAAALTAGFRAKGKDVVVSSDDVLVSLVRPVFAAPAGRSLGIVDYNAVEARGAAWLFNEQWMLDCFNDPKRDIYCEYWGKVTGSPITKKDPLRNVAKICVLGLQYGMGAGKLAIYAKKAGINLAALGLTAEGLLKDYRDNCPNIKAGWKEIGESLREARLCGFSTCCNGKVSFRGVGSDHLFCELPSHRILTYRNCRFVRGVPGYCAILGIPPFETDLLRYQTPRGWDVDLYATKATENIVQGFCADLLTGALVELDKVQDPVLHVHDEAVDEGKEEEKLALLDAQCSIMSTPPAWCRDFPLRVDGFTCHHYVKSKWSDSYACEYMRGVKL